MNLDKLQKWHQTKIGLSVYAGFELFAAYIMASFAIDSGSLFHYFLFFVFFTGGLVNSVKLVRKLLHDKKPKKQ